MMQHPGKGIPSPEMCHVLKQLLLISRLFPQSLPWFGEIFAWIPATKPEQSFFTMYFCSLNYEN